MSKFLDSNGVLYLWQKIKAAFVQKVEGKGLSTEDFTSEEKEKLAGLSAYTLPMATDSTIGGVSVARVWSGEIPVNSDIAKIDTHLQSTDGKVFACLYLGDGITKYGIATGNGTYQAIKLKPASTDILGGIKVQGKGAAVQDSTKLKLYSDLDGVGEIFAPNATKTSYGFVKVGDGIDITDGVISVGAVSWDSITGKPDLTNVYNYKGSVANVANLPTEGNTKGDVWNVEATDMNYAWTGEAWDPLGGSFSVDAITNAEIDAIVAG